MQTRTIVLIGVLVLLLAGPALAGQARLQKVDAPLDGKVLCDLELVNDSGKDDKFKVSARVVCDKENGKGIVKGKKVKFSIKLGAGETLDEVLSLKLPKKGHENVRVECMVQWKKGREELNGRPETDAAGNEGDGVRGDGEKPSDRPTDRPFDGPIGFPGGDPVELSGTLLIEKVEVDFPMPMMDGIDGKEKPEVDGYYQLSILTDDGETWILIGGEADYVTKLMLAAELQETEAEISGLPLVFEMPDFPTDKPIPFDVHPTNGEVKWDKGPGFSGGKGKGKGKGLSFGPSDLGKMMILLKWDAKGLEDKRPKFVGHRPVLKGPLCKFDKSDEKVVGNVDDWKTLLTDAGIRLPAKKEIPETDAVKKMDAAGNGWVDGTGFGFEIKDGFPGGIRGDDKGDFPFYGMPWEVDFEKEMVIAIFAGEQLSTGYGVAIKSITEEEDGLLVKYAIHEPGKHEVVVDVPTTPFAMVAIRATDAEISFQLITADKPDDAAK